MDLNPKLLLSLYLIFLFRHPVDNVESYNRSQCNANARSRAVDIYTSDIALVAAQSTVEAAIRYPGVQINRFILDLTTVSVKSSGSSSL